MFDESNMDYMTNDITTKRNGTKKLKKTEMTLLGKLLTGGYALVTDYQGNRELKTMRQLHDAGLVKVKYDRGLNLYKVTPYGNPTIAVELG